MTSPADFHGVKASRRTETFARYDGPIDLDVATEVVELLRRRGPVSFFRWRGRSRALLRIPWREGHAVAHRRGRRYLLEVRLVSGVELTLVTTRAALVTPPDLVALERLRVWVGGTGDRMIVLLGDVPMVVAAKKPAKDPR
ncbi:MAG: hypothetical protein QOI21_4320 [Actinomycetota bacterium]|nr:hypothetical protein [Actinomycetota bacterium]